MTSQRMENTRQGFRLTFSHMRDTIAKIGDISPPAVRQFQTVELWKDANETALKEPCPSLWIMNQIPGTAAKQNTPPVRGWPEVGQQTLGVSYHPVSWEQLGDSIFTQFLGSNLV